uniref:BZIP domain-containing protein n=1 Tax=Macrostomum lignano TaxID=282301 RepID=A0A1I8IVI3_9PLAT
SSPRSPVPVNDGIKRQSVLPAVSKIPHIHIGIAGSFHLAPQQQGVFSLPTVRLRWSNKFCQRCQRHGSALHALNLEPQYNSPDQAQGQPGIAINNVVRAEILQSFNTRPLVQLSAQILRLKLMVGLVLSLFAKIGRSEAGIAYTFECKDFNILFYKTAAFLDNTIAASPHLNLGDMVDIQNHLKSEVIWSLEQELSGQDGAAAASSANTMAATEEMHDNVISGTEESSGCKFLQFCRLSGITTQECNATASASNSGARGDARKKEARRRAADQLSLYRSLAQQNFQLKAARQESKETRRSKQYHVNVEVESF